MKKFRRLSMQSAAAVLEPVPIRGPGAPGVDQIRNAYVSRRLAEQRIQQMETSGTDLARSAVAKWTSEVAAKGSIDLAAAAKAYADWKRSQDVVAEQSEAVAALSKMVEEQIAYFKKTDPLTVVAVLKTEIAKLQSGLDHQQKDQSAIQAQLQQLLDELNGIDPDQPGYAKESGKTHRKT